MLPPWESLRKLGKRLSGFTASAILSAIASLVAIPLIIRLHGDDQWATFAVAQSLGFLLAVVVGFGWAVTGSATIAPLEAAERRAEYARALVTRASLLLVVSILVLIVLLPGFIAGSQELVPVTLAYATTGLSTVWYFTGTGQSWRAFWYDTIPRSTAIVLAPLVAQNRPTQLVMGAVIAAGSLIGVVLSSIYILREGTERPTSMALRSSARRQVAGVVSGGISSVYMTVPVIVVGAMLPTATVAVFALGDKLVRLVSSGVRPITQVFQGWIPAAPPTERRSRIRRGLATAVVLGATMGASLTIFGPTLATVLSGGKLALDWSLTVPMGLVLACTIITQCSGPGCLGSYGDFRAIATSAALGAAAGVPALVFGTMAWGAPGAMWAVALAELVVLTWQLLALRRNMKSSAA